MAAPKIGKNKDVPEVARAAVGDAPWMLEAADQLGLI
jgi:hypothetical protein